jgi:hypothetical protein
MSDYDDTHEFDFIMLLREAAEAAGLEPEADPDNDNPELY